MLARGVKSMTPVSVWQTQVSASLPLTGGHLVPVGTATQSSTCTELSRKRSRISESLGVLSGLFIGLFCFWVD